MTETIVVKDFSKKLKNQLVLNNVNYQFNKGEIYGIFGRNGSGKTMLLRAISGLIRPTEGSVHIDDQQLHEDVSFPKSVGIIIENTGLLNGYDAVTNLKMLATIKKIASKEDIVKSIERVGLDANNRKKVKTYSLGMKQRLSIAQAIFEKPDIILLDEPTNGLDPDGIDLIRNILLEEKQRGAIIILASHNTEDIRILADHQIEMRNGEIIFDVETN